MKIVQYLDRVRLELGGVVRAVLDLCAALAQRGHEVSLLTFDAADVPKAWRDGAAGVPRLIALDPPTGFKGKIGLLPPGALHAADAALEGADVLHLHTPWASSNVQIANLARQRGMPYVLSVHGMLDDWSMSQRAPKKRMYLALTGRRLLENAAAVHCTAQGELDQAKKWFPGGRGVVAPLVFDVEPFRDLPGPGPGARLLEGFAVDGPLVLFLSRIHVKKGIELLIEAAATLRDRAVDCRVAIAGSGDDAYVESLQRLTRERSLDDRVRFVGLVLGAEKVSLFQTADVFVLPTSQENFGLVLPEALACATPVITTKGVDIWPELEQSGGAVIVDADARSIADAIGSLLKDDQKRDAMGRAGRQWVMTSLDGKSVVEAYERLYDPARTRS